MPGPRGVKPSPPASARDGLCTDGLLMLLTVSPMTCPDTRPTSYGYASAKSSVGPVSFCFLKFQAAGNSLGPLTPVILMKLRLGQKGRGFYAATAKAANYLSEFKISGDWDGLARFERATGHGLGIEPTSPIVNQ